MICPYWPVLDGLVEIVERGLTKSGSLPRSLAGAHGRSIVIAGEV
jgi:hypothetical protein